MHGSEHCWTVGTLLGGGLVMNVRPLPGVRERKASPNMRAKKSAAFACTFPVNLEQQLPARSKQINWRSGPKKGHREVSRRLSGLFGTLFV
jgi:hypothetical protein